MGNNIQKRNGSIETLRFVFCVLIINYHFLSYYLWYTDYPNFFIRGYMGDEFFFIISGYFLADSAMKTDKNAMDFTCSHIIKRLRKIAVPYYLTWAVCFLGRHFSDFVLGNTEGNILLNLANSIYELCFLEMFGFQAGYYSNPLSWFFSSMLIVLFLISPFAVKFKKGFTHYLAPLIGLFSYGLLSLNCDFLFAPTKVIANTCIMKGLIRALAAICMGCFMHGLINSKLIQKKRLNKKIIWLADLLLWLVIILYMVIPFESDNFVLFAKFDIIISLLMVPALIPLLSNDTKRNQSVEEAAMVVGRYAFYAYFGQAAFYSIEPIILKLNLSGFTNFAIHNGGVIAFTLILWAINSLLKHQKATNNVV